MNLDPLKRVNLVKEEIKIVLDRADDCEVLVNMIEKGKIPLRVTNNDR